MDACKTGEVTPNLAHMLRRVVHDVFDETVEVASPTAPGQEGISEVELSAQYGEGRRAVRLTASTTGVFGIDIVDLGFGAVLIEYDDAAYMEAIIQNLASVAHAYLSGAGRIENKRGVLGVQPVLTIAVNGEVWTLGHRRSGVFYPGDASS